MADLGEEETPTVTEGDTPADFLKALGKTLNEKEGVDAGLAEVLVKHLLTAAPNAGAVAQAKDAILKLADERANPPNTEPANG